MPIFFLPADAVTPPTITVPPELLTHLRDSLRVEVGEEIVFADEQGARYRTEITQSSKQGLTGRILDTMHEPPRQVPAMILVQAILKGEKMDWVIQKATELGVNQIVPLQSRHTIVQMRPERVEAQTARWQRIALEAAQQSEQWRIPAVTAPQSLKEFCAQPGDHATRLILAERREGISLRQLALPSQAENSIILFVGPEGGWSKQEVLMAEQASFESITLGPQILRADTAAIAAISILQSRLGKLE
jgi:16S rRNA (uracil1498-N3)-methyltransferase